MSINQSVNPNSTTNTSDFIAEYNLFKIIGKLEFGKAHDQNQGGLKGSSDNRRNKYGHKLYSIPNSAHHFIHKK